MAVKLSDIYLFSDFDGTVYSPILGEIPEENIRAIRRFIEKGGHFGLATGRSPNSAKSFLEQLPVNAPCLCLNGGAAYDMERDEYLYANFLAPGAEEYTRQLLEAFPHWDCAVVTMEGYNYVADPDRAVGRMNVRGYRMNPGFREPIPGEWLKVVFNTPEGEAKVFMDSGKVAEFPDVDFTTSDTFFVEMLPKGTSKGAAILAVCEKLGLTIGQTVAVGDYYNDVEMLKTAGFSACVGGAPEELKELVDVVLCPCEEGSIAQLIGLLEERHPE